MQLIFSQGSLPFTVESAKIVRRGVASGADKYGEYREPEQRKTALPCLSSVPSECLS